MFPKKGKIVSSGRQYRNRNIILELFGGIKLIFLVVVFLLLIGVFNKESKITNKTDPIRENSQQLIQNHKNSDNSIPVKTENNNEIRQPRKSEFNPIREQVF